MKAPSPLFLFLQPNQKLGFLDLLHLSLLSPFQGFTFPTRHRCIHRSSLSLSAICMPVLLLLSFFLRCFGYGFFYFFFLRFGCFRACLSKTLCLVRHYAYAIAFWDFEENELRFMLPLFCSSRLFSLWFCIFETLSIVFDVFC